MAPVPTLAEPKSPGRVPGGRKGVGRGGRSMIRRFVPWAIAGIAALAAGCDRERSASADGHLLAFPATLDFARVAMYGDHTLDVELQNAGRSVITLEEIAFDGVQGAYSADLPELDPDPE